MTIFRDAWGLAVSHLCIQVKGIGIRRAQLKIWNLSAICTRMNEPKEGTTCIQICGERKVKRLGGDLEAAFIFINILLISKSLHIISKLCGVVVNMPT